MSRLLYISQSYVPSRRADSIHVMHMCDALAGASHDVELITKRCPPRCEPDIGDDFAFYGVSPRFRLRKLMRPNYRGGGVAFAASVSMRLRQVARSTDLAFCRFLWGARDAVHLGIPTIYEAHGLPTGRLARRWFREILASGNLERLVVITSGLLDDLETMFTLPRGKVLVEPDAVRTDFAQAVDRAASTSLRPRVGYLGHLYEGRGIPTIIALAERIPEADFEIVGGHDAAIETWRRQARSPNLSFSGFVQPHELPRAHARFDVLLMPHECAVSAQSGRSNIVRWMSPMKMFEYMATGRPIVASNLPALREVLEHDINALLAEPGEVDSWEAEVRKLLTDHELSRRLGDTARRQVNQTHTWDLRAARILEGVA